MMRDPESLDLVEAARRTLVEAIAPALSAEQRYQVLLVANALAIAGRELRTPDAVLGQEAAAAARLLGLPAAEAAPARALADLEAQLARAIRAGAFDDPGPGQADLLGHLRAMVRRTLGETNPAYLAARDAEAD